MGLLAGLKKSEGFTKGKRCERVVRDANHISCRLLWHCPGPGKHNNSYSRLTEAVCAEGGAPGGRLQNQRRVGANQHRHSAGATCGLMLCTCGGQYAARKKALCQLHTHEQNHEQNAACNQSGCERAAPCSRVARAGDPSSYTAVSVAPPCKVCTLPHTHTHLQFTHSALTRGARG